MVFSSSFFIFFFLPITLVLTLVSQHSKYKNLILLIISVLFYVFGEGELVLLMFGSITLNYFLGKWVGKSSTKVAISVGVIINILILIVFKYTGFLIENINEILQLNKIAPLPKVEIKLPAGISFYTFHSISYLIDVYRKDNKVQKSYVDMALYIGLFPQLIAGPIIRYKDIAYQFASRKINAIRFQNGVERFIIGLAKKVIIANNIGYTTDLIFNINPTEISLPLAWLGIISYSLQLYFDFSGYSDMAIGLAKMLGFDFLENFNFPYKATSIKEFWARWHISLSNWFRDYLYIPLGGNRLSPLRTYLNLSIVFFLTGLWHGASWNFIIWGIIHGFFLIMERLWLSAILNKVGVLKHVYTLLVVMLAWVFFRIDELDKAVGYIKALFLFNANSSNTIEMYLNFELVLAICIAILLSFNGFNFWYKKVVLNCLLRFKNNTIINYQLFKNLKALSLIIIFIYACFNVFSNTYNPFIYFRF